MKMVTTALGACLLVGGIANPAAAQSVNLDTGSDRIDTRATVSLTIPFGGRESHAESKPRFDLTLARGGPDHENATDATQFRSPVDGTPLDRRYRQISVSLTAEDQPKVLLNGKDLQRLERIMAKQDASKDSAQEEPTEGETEEERAARLERERKRREDLGEALETGATVALVAGGVVAVGLAALVIAISTSDLSGE